MAQIQEQTVVIRLSKLLKTGDKQSASLLPASVEATIEALIAEIIDDSSVIVEVGDAED